MKPNLMMSVKECLLKLVILSVQLFEYPFVSKSLHPFGCKSWHLSIHDPEILNKFWDQHFARGKHGPTNVDSIIFCVAMTCPRLHPYLARTVNNCFCNIVVLL